MLKCIVKINHKKLFVDKINNIDFILVILKTINGIIIINNISLINFELIKNININIKGNLIIIDKIKNIFHLFILQINRIHKVNGKMLFFIHIIIIINILTKFNIKLLLVLIITDNRNKVIIRLITINFEFNSILLEDFISIFIDKKNISSLIIHIEIQLFKLKIIINKFIINIK